MSSNKSSGLEGILGGLGKLIGGLAELAEKGEELKKSGTFSSDSGKAKIVYGFTIKGVGGDDVRVEPFGNVTRDSHTHETIRPGP